MHGQVLLRHGVHRYDYLLLKAEVVLYQGDLALEVLLEIVVAI